MIQARCDEKGNQTKLQFLGRFSREKKTQNKGKKKKKKQIFLGAAQLSVVAVREDGQDGREKVEKIAFLMSFEKWFLVAEEDEEEEEG